MKKTIISVVLVIVILVGLVPIGVFAADSNKLSVLKFTAGTSKTASAHTLIPEFSPDVREYTLIVPDSTATVAVWATLGSGSSGAIKAVYKKTNNTNANVSVTSGKTTGTSLSSLVTASKLAGATIEITIGGNTEYTVNVVRQATLKGLTITSQGETVEYSPSFNAATYEYKAVVPKDALLNIVPSTKTSTASFSINGASSTEITPVWNGLEAKVEIIVYGG